LYARTQFRILTLPTNGLLTDRIVANTRKILEFCPQATVAVSISLDGFPDTHDAIRQVPGAFKRACETFSQLQQLKSHYPNFKLIATLTLSAYNQQEFSEFYCYVRDELRPDNIGIGLLRGTPKQPEAADIDIAFYQKVNAIYRSDMIAGKLAYYPPPTGKLLCARELRVRELVAQIHSEKRMLLPCLAGRLSAVILENGEVRPCEVLDRSLGNLRQSGCDFSTIWNSASADAVRDSIQAGCYCTYECALSSNVLFNLSQYPALLRILWALK
jgi:MoaA/NifB/PqqE/SkfB family radical SAM enzyme